MYLFSMCVSSDKNNNKLFVIFRFLWLPQTSTHVAEFSQNRISNSLTRVNELGCYGAFRLQFAINQDDYRHFCNMEAICSSYS